jgi:hypothetical protein
VLPPEVVHRGGEGVQAPGQHPEAGQPAEKGEEEPPGGNAEAQPEDVALAEHLDGRVVLLGGQDDVQVPADGRAFAPGRDGRHREDLLARAAPRVVPQDGKDARGGEKPVDRLERDPLALDRSRRGREGQDVPLGPEQVELDVGVDDHQHVEDVLEHRLVDASVLHEDLLGYEVLGQPAVQLLVDLLDVPLRREHGEEHVRGAEDGKQHQQEDGELAVEGPAHGLSS